MGEARGKLFTIPAEVSFLDALARTILVGNLPRAGGPPPSPLDLAGYTLYLPNRRACRAMREAFLSANSTKSRAMLLPRILALGDVDEQSLLLTPPIENDGSTIAGETPPTIEPLERIMVLSRMIFSWMQNLHGGDLWASAPTDLFAKASPANAVELAFELARLADQTQIEDRGLSSLETLAPEHFANHWRLTLGFLRIVAEQWPRYLEATGAIDPMQRRNLLLRLEAERIASPNQTSLAPVIIAGVTGCAPAAWSLMKAVLASQQGAIVIPGLDLRLDEDSWQMLTPEHPQHSLKQLLDRLGATRSDVSIPIGVEPSPQSAIRQIFLGEALRPTGTTHLWRRFIDAADRNALREALAPISIVAAPTPQDEAQVIALLLREAAETPGKTASLVTPDRNLARRVSALMLKWGVAIDDSGGAPLPRTRQGAFLDLIAEVAQTGAPTALLSLIKHPLAGLGLPRPELRRRSRVLELLAVRQPWLERGLSGLRQSLNLTKDALKRSAIRHPTLTRLSDARRAGAFDLLDRLDHAFAPFLNLNAKNSRVGDQPLASQPLANLAKAHRAVAEALAADDSGPSAELWSGPAGGALNALLTRLADNTLPSPDIAFSDYVTVYRSLIRQEVVRPTQPAHPRLAIWGPLEARLLRPDMVILGGLNEGVWPETPDSGPWLNRPMRTDLGLASPEHLTGLAAHDFTQLMAAPEVILTRALKSDGAPTSPSRWIARINTVLKGLGLDRDQPPVFAPNRPWIYWSLSRHASLCQRPSPAAPAPCPPIASRPRKLPITAIETWLANPYAIFARHILQLSPLPELASGLHASDRGQIIHEALAEFCRRYPAELPSDIAGELIQIAESLMTRLGNGAKARAFWRPRFERFSCWFAETEPKRRTNIVRVLTELRGSLTIEAPAGPFILTARADRIDLTSTGLLAIYDYKSGSAPSESAVSTFRSPQLPLEALIAANGGFQLASPTANAEASSEKDNPRTPMTIEICKLAYVSATGGEPPGEETIITKHSPAALAEAAHTGVSTLISLFDQPDTPYRALRRSNFENHYRYDAYAHLARAAEWFTSVNSE
jgi:ATP-dependent helicase/nuclease subunit B